MTFPDPAHNDDAPMLRVVVACEVAETPPEGPKVRGYCHGLAASRVGRAFLAELQTIAPLSRKEEQDLARRAEAGERTMLRALLALDSVRDAVHGMLCDAAAGHVSIDKVLEASPNDEVAQARLRKLLDALARASNESERIELLSGVRLGRDALHRLASEAVGQPAHVKAEFARGRQVAERAKRELVRRHLWLAVHIASRHGTRGVDLMDRIQEGCLGLMRAADRFRVRKGFRFATYAAWWVRRAIHRAVAEQGHCVRLPSRTLEAAQKAERVQQRFNACSGRVASDEHLAGALCVSVQRLREVQRGVSDAISFDEPEHVLAATTPNPERLVAILEQQRVLRDQLTSLTPREQQVLALRFGLDDDDEASRDAVASVFSLTRERIRQIEKTAIERLQHPARAASWA